MKNVLLTFALTALVASGALNWCFISGKMQRETPDYLGELTSPNATQPVKLARR